MNDIITVYASQDLTTLVRSFEVEALDEPNDELTGKYQYSISINAFRDAYNNWNHDQSPLLTIHDHLSHTNIYLGKPSAERIRDAIEENKTSVQLF